MGIDVQSSALYMESKLWSAVWNGHFVSAMQNESQSTKVQRTLVQLIRNYQQHNAISSSAATQQERLCVPLFISQIFYHLVRKFKADNSAKFIIRSVLMGLSVLQRELVSFQFNTLKLTPFMHSLCTEQQVVFLQECRWEIDEKRMEKLKHSPPDNYLWSGEFVFDYPDGKKVAFSIGIARGGGDDTYSGIAFRMDRLPNWTVSGRWSVSLPV